MRQPRPTGVAKRVLLFVFVSGGALVLTAAFFFLLPLIAAITEPPTADLTLQQMDTANLPPPPPPPQEEPEEEPEPEEKPPELAENDAPLDLAQLELALGSGSGGGWATGPIAANLGVGAGAADAKALFSLSDLDQRPRAIYQPNPVTDAKMRRQAPGKVYIIFIVNERGRVENPIVQRSSDPVFDRAALAAVKKWKFEPGKREGKAVRFRMRVPITFPKG